MQNLRKSRCWHGLLTFLVVAAISILAFLTYRDILSYRFPANTTWSLIETCKIQSAQDVIRILTKPTVYGTSQAEFFKSYRPISELLCSVDYAVWKLNPAGYQFTNLALQVIVTILVFLFFRFLFGGKLVIAALSAIIFATHPNLVENVPAFPRNMDFLVALFLLCSFWLFIKYHRAPRKKHFLIVASIGLYLLALGSKEIAVIFPVMILVWTLLFILPSHHRYKSFLHLTAKTVVVIMPYVIATVAFIFWRAYVLKSLVGGPINLTIWKLSTIVQMYFTCLFYPNSFLSPIVAYLGRNIDIAVGLSSILTIATVLIIDKRAHFMSRDDRGTRPVKKLRIALGTILCLSLVGMLISIFLTPVINNLIKKAYEGKALSFFTKMLQGKDVLPVEHYYWRAKSLVLKTLFWIFASSGIVLALVHNKDKIWKHLLGSYTGRVAIFLICWMLTPLGFYLWLRTFSHWRMYVAVIPACAVLSIILVNSISPIIASVRRNRSIFSLKSLQSIKSAYLNIICFTLTAALVISLVSYSPLIRPYREWKDSGVLCAMIFDKLSQVVEAMPQDETLHIYDLPKRIRSYKNEMPHVKTVTYLEDYTIKSWLNIYYPDNHFDVVVHSYSTLEDFPDFLDLKVEKEDKDALIRIVTNPDIESE